MTTPEEAAALAPPVPNPDTEFLILTGWTVIPIAQVINIETGKKVGDVGLGGTPVPVGDLGRFEEVRWPVMFEALRAQFKQNQVDTAAAVTPPRAVRRAKAAAPKKAAALTRKAKPEG